MSASKKMTDRQNAEKKEANQVKLYTIAFVVILIAFIAIAIVSGVKNHITNSGVHEKNTVAATVGGVNLSNADLSYYYIDAINNFYNNYGSYAAMYGLDTSTPLDQQAFDAETGETWADYFVNQAAGSAQAAHALAADAKANGFSLPEDQKAQLEILSSNVDGYATMYGYANGDAFIQAQYGKGTSKAGYLAYYENNILASAYQAAHQEGLTYTNDQIREADAKDPTVYSSYSYNQYYLATSKFLTGGTTDEDGTTTYTVEERAAAAAEALAAADALTAETITSVEEFDAAIAALSVNEGTSAASTAYNNQRSSSVNSYLSDWMTDSARQEGDKTYVAVTNTTTDENGNETENVTAYYVAFYRGLNTNENSMVNVRHILYSFESDESGEVSEESKTAAKASAEDILAQWAAGDATEESFAALANDNSSDTGSNTNGGLYENVYPGQMVAAFNDWCFDASRKAGDTGIVETEYGYHVMYFVGNTEQTYRDYLIENDLVTADMESWYSDLLSKNEVVMGDTQYLNKSIVLAR